MTRRIGVAPATATTAAVLFVGWTWLTLRTEVLAPLDALSLGRGAAASSACGQILTTFAMVSSPVVVYAVLAGFAFWAVRRRLTRLGAAMIASIVVGALGSLWLRALFARPRPPERLPLITSEGFSYPSGHMVAATIAAVMIAAAQVITRRRRLYTVLTMTLLAVLWWCVLGDRIAVRAHWFSDLIGGGFFGVFVATASLAVFGVHVNRVFPTGENADATLRCAVLFNPTKIPDPALFRRQVDGECRQRGWEPPLWLESDAEDSGAAASRRARRAEVDLALIAGGDGTVRAACAELAGSGIPIGILPAGTGNLLARNLGVPLDMAEALDVAFDGTPRPIDLIEVRADDREPECSLVMAGIGADALIMAETNDDLKKFVGSAAYVIAALQTLNKAPFSVRVTVGDHEPIERRVGLAMVANVGAIQGQIQIAPDARPDDGRVDLVLASPDKPTDWGAITTRILARAIDAPGIERAQAKVVTFDVDAPIAYQIDGDAMGECSHLEATTLTHVLRIMAPARRR
ncbi:diacylglycerol kinase family protein [Propioniciclava flava]|uniref:DAGKc domain-containing protein n=1 Tax=Propioniciclava flava TaxID=2072026 RepID=A0A4Q2EHS7_9ACTN|nr:diacylglycerol kinase family protein [Propioniciclava flava]RXW31435.1 hypothetical protein C1706_12270 [Propioniciclava flava]